MIIFMVAEKPSLALSISQILSHGQLSSRKGFNNVCSVHEWTGRYQSNSSARFRMTSVAGHVFGIDFVPRYNNWDKVDPAELFSGETLKKEASPNHRMPAFLEKESRGADVIVLWLDCDKEGENICFEVIDCIDKSINQNAKILRAKFSSITDKDIRYAFENLSYPDKNQSLSVDARQELDLRIGCAFTRFQTRFFQGKYGDLDSSCISYGPCQTPTLGFCVDRHDKIQSFQSEPYWLLTIEIKHKNDKIFKLHWDRGHVFDKEIAYFFLNNIKAANKVRVLSVKTEKKHKGRPNALNTVDLLKVASAGLGMSPHHAMQIAERLYTSGYISYPRTETTQYAENADLKSVLRELTHCSDSDWQTHIKSLLSEGQYTTPKRGKDVGDHPPITPVKAASSAAVGGGDYWRIYDYVCRHFIATVSPDCVYEETTVLFDASDETFSLSGKNVIEPGFTSIMSWKRLSNDEPIPSFTANEIFTIEDIKIDERHTTAPDYLTESELISLMEKHGIGTDASIPVHINNICERNYVKVDNGRRLIPTSLGIVLVHGYQKIDPELSLPHMRSSVETELNEIALGRINYQQLVPHVLRIFEQKFHYFVQHIQGMDSLFEVSFSSLAASGKPFVRCGKCRRYMKLIESKPSRLHCETCKDTYNLPQNGLIKGFKELRCPLDEFELVQYAANNNAKNFTLCPYCYNNPPFKDMHKNSGCNECTHPTCRYSLEVNGVCACYICKQGIFLLDVSAIPKYRLACNKCPFVLTLPETIQKITIKSEFCEKCDTALMDVEFNKEKSPDLLSLSSACLLCHEYFLEAIQRTVTYLNNLQNRPTDGRGGAFGGPRGGGRGGRGGRGRGRGRGGGGSSRGRGSSRGGHGRGRN
ncbi:unnamed protein product [Rotaria socialis]|uniref:DNA topoisomerase n=8 Tax=Rotaria socialis TaxID=392032 RepID=A0A818V9V0_9BILA|nr:unnamed protein product [Rotaria socialis]CAF3351742.1 unnamed protein product [Rotaria socialis]CAF3563682.1 unnamed protein product [Rotaria socialis]CAF3703887.1 unnamed protein product [Rotaria socialis]CAF4319886.1 unnamed protein product [Rotaria socialis]